MRLIRNRPGPNGNRHLPGGSVVTIGNFDGLHLGHHALLHQCRELASPERKVAVVTFEPLPIAYFSPQKAPARLTTVHGKLAILRSLGVDLTWMMRFDEVFAALSARAFAEQVLVRGLGAEAVVVGHDFHFGRGREGNADTLRALGDEFGFEEYIVPPVVRDGQRVSSSGVRGCLSAGDFAGAARLLGRPFRMDGHVVYGQALGRKLGYPTANLRIRSEPSPLTGVLATWARVDGGPWLPGVSNLGRRPAVGGGDPLLEVHFFDFDEDIYGKRLEVQFVAKLREEEHFDCLEWLVVQMKKDESAAREILARSEKPAD
ncbi:MAG: bifunctional riboflavin kinase/FAD synthetase [Xanthomonadales bacterium]|jgi:riboflavin kinase/FMN adenylyltransferase|nr:bifunctional riboflavin kinase/FAD synthetase [Xanthomonadales bacterium]